MTNRLKHAPRLILGFDSLGRPIYSVGGAQDDFTVEPDDDAAPDDDPDADPQDGDAGKSGKKSYQPPDYAEWVRVQASLTKANASAKARREELAVANKRLADLEHREQERQANEERARLLASNQPQQPTGKRGKGGQAPTAPTTLPDNVLTPAQVRQREKAAAEAAETAASERYRDQLARTAARAELVDAGVPKASAKRLVALLDIGEIEMDEEGNIVGGMEDQLEQLRAELPQLFAAPEPEKPKRTRPAPPRIPAANAAPQTPVDNTPRSSAERLAAIALGNR